MTDLGNAGEQQDMNYAGSTCICRVPKAQLKAGVVVGELLAPLSHKRLPASVVVR